MASRPRVFSVVKENGRVAFNDAVNGRQYLTIGIADVHEKSLPDVVVYGLTQAILDAGATNEGITDRVRKMQARALAIKDGAWHIGERVASGLVMAATFAAARAVGLWRSKTDAEARDAWKELSDGMRAKVAGQPDVIAELAKTQPDAGAELESMFE